jgi:D-alanyl-D-alanine carboxypeptidase
LRLPILCAAGIAALTLGACAVYRHEAEAPAPERARLTPAVQQRIDAIMLGAIAHQHLASVTLAIARDGSIIYARGYGYRDLAKRLPATPNTIYNIASISKQFTAACIMLLQQDGKLTIDDPLSKYLPDFPNAGRITLRNLLNHTSGLVDYLDILDAKDLSTPKILAALRKAPLRFAPGTQYQYSNSNYILLGEVVHKASGVPFDAFVRRRVFQPLGLVSTSVGTAPKDLPNGALGYTVVDGRIALAPQLPASALDFPDGGVNTSVRDLVKWDAALDSGQLVRDNLLQMMFTPGPHGDETTYRYGLGLVIDNVYGHREVAHQGEYGGYAGENVTFPDDRFSVILLGNTEGFNEELIAREIFALFFPPTPGQESAALASAPGEHAATTLAARSWLEALTSGTVDRKKMTPGLAASTSDAELGAFRRELGRNGALERFSFVVRDSDSAGATDYYRLYYPGAIFSYGFRLSRAGKIESFSLSRED